MDACCFYAVPAAAPDCQTARGRRKPTRKTKHKQSTKLQKVGIQRWILVGIGARAALPGGMVPWGAAPSAANITPKPVQNPPPSFLDERLGIPLSASDVLNEPGAFGEQLTLGVVLGGCTVRPPPPLYVGALQTMCQGAILARWRLWKGPGQVPGARETRRLTHFCFFAGRCATIFGYARTLQSVSTPDDKHFSLLFSVCLFYCSCQRARACTIHLFWDFVWRHFKLY